MIDAHKIGRLVAEAVLNDPGPCFYPGKFKPPHKGHFEAAKDLASRNYITKVFVIISNKVIDGITPEDSLAIWNMYLEAQKLPKVTVRISTDESPVQTIIKYLNTNTEVDPVYVAAGDDESDDKDYAKSLQTDYGDRVKIIKVQEKYGEITAPYVREILKTGDYEKFIEAVPEAAYNRGAGPKAFKILAPKIKDDEPTEP